MPAREGCDRPIQARLTIGITTKDRWEVLRGTLAVLAGSTLADVRVVVVDDGSATPCPYRVESVHPSAELHRFDTSAGLIVRRNWLVGMTQTPYYLSLDDDSYPVSGDIGQALDFIDSRPEVACLGFPIYNPQLKQFQIASVLPQPYPVRTFVGCAHIVDVDCFFDVGGYREELVHFKEESDLTVRLFRQGLRTYHYPNVTFHHHYTPVGRNWNRMDYYGARNNVLWNDWYLPTRLQPWRQATNTVSRLIQFARTRRLGHLRGHWTGVRSIARFRKNRCRLSWDEYRAWRRQVLS